jgi:hypothetical protein
MRLFFAHPRAWSDEEINLFVAAVQESIQGETSKDVEVTAGRDDYQQRIAGCGHIDTWCRDIVVRTDYQTGLAWYAAIVIPRTEGIGKATATITRYALAAQMPVMAVWEEAGEIRTTRVTGVREVDGEDYLSGWRIICDS